MRLRLLERYVLRCYRGPVFYCLLTFCMVFVVSNLFDNLSKLLAAKPPLRVAVGYYTCRLLPVLEFLMPAALMLATLYTLWQFTHHNEITAMRASGVSARRIMRPFLMIGLMFSLAGMILKETVTPRAMRWSTEFYRSGFKPAKEDLRHNVGYYNSRARRAWMIGAMDMKAPNLLRRVTVTEEREDGVRIREITARRAEWLDGAWWFEQPKVQRYDANDNPVGGPVSVLPQGQRAYELSWFPETPGDIVRAGLDAEYLNTRELLDDLAANKELSSGARAQRLYDIHARLAMPWACLVVTLFAFPAGIRTGRQNALTGIFTAVGLFLAFYMLSQVGLFAGKRELVAPWIGAWLSNLTFLTAGLAMLARLK